MISNVDDVQQLIADGDEGTALPLVTGPLRGLSAYSENGINKALVSSDLVIEVLRSRYEW